jgi:hypothetical protein
VNPVVLQVIITIAAISLIVVCFSLFSKQKDRKARRDLDAQFGRDPSDRFSELKIDSISSYWSEKWLNDDTENCIDEITWNDLDMDKVFSRVCACQTSAGEECLYAVLHEPSAKEKQPLRRIAESNRLLRREKLISQLEADPGLRNDVQVILSRMGKVNYNGLSSFCYDVTSKKLTHTMLYTILAFLPLLFFGLMLVDLKLGFSGLLANLIVNGVVYYMATSNISQELTAIRYFSVLLWCAGRLGERFHGIGDETINDMTSAHKTFRKLGGKLSQSGQQKLSDLDSIIEYFRIITLSNIRHYNTVMDVLEKNTGTFRQLYTSLGEVDIAVSVSSYRKSLPFCARPDFISGNRLTAEELYHPLLKDPVCNTVSVTKSSLVSGSNASGKSTFIKALAVNAILAQTINTCTAKRFETRPALVLTSMAIRDDITSGDSYFISEIKSLKRIVDRIPQVNCICFIDEILRGTNTIERIAASASVLEHLSELDCLCLVATHDIELTALLADTYHNYHFSEQVTEQGVAFDYLIREGPTESKNAILLLEHLGFDKQIISEAQKIVRTFEETERWRL